jgi:peptidyl-prolyl cis-trans isomerase B (cyclophilin B)
MMINKMNFYSLLTIAMVFGGCVKKTPQTPAAGEQQQTQQTLQVQQTNENIQNERENVSIENKKVKLETSMGDIVIELNAEKAPVTVKNFLSYVDSGFYNGTIFHRVVNVPTLHVIQGGGFTKDMVQKKTQAPIKNEATNGLSNDRGTIAMARTNNPDSATCQFFINHVDNSFLNYTGPANPGYAVFGKVIEGMDVVDKIAEVKTTVRSGMENVPVETVVINSASVIPE